METKRPLVVCHSSFIIRHLYNVSFRPTEKERPATPLVDGRGAGGALHSVGRFVVGTDCFRAGLSAAPRDAGLSHGSYACRAWKNPGPQRCCPRGKPTHL